MFNRRHFLRAAGASLAVSASGWLAPFANAAAADPKRKRSCILLWMNGGPSTIDLWDLKPGHENGGPFKEIQTNVPGMKISEHLPTLAKFGDKMAILRGMSTKEGDHERASFQMKTGQLPMGPINYPNIGSLISKEIGSSTAELPNFVSIASRRIFFLNDPASPGFLGPNYAPLMVGTSNAFNEPSGDKLWEQLKVENLERPKSVDAKHGDSRLSLLRDMQEDFAGGRPTAISDSHVAAYDRAARLMTSNAAEAFDMTKEKPADRDRYGKSLFGQGCLLARRLVEKGVPFVEVTMSGWDTHGNNFDFVKKNSEHLDKGWGQLMIDLKERGLLDSTLIVWMGEFGRTPRINGGNGRDHYPNAWATVLAGGGIKGGQVIGKTSKDGTTVEDRKTNTNDLLATVCGALGIDHEKQNMSNVGRPIRIVDKSAQPVTEVVS
ncbi:DUF1501 domain-containing protein [Limnoglobus roseus]|uniref:DUF1501 domain-containing protein n=1 Tax=Limnoglobus roseus TaxID=2598579 RepID=A0A5C1A6Q9_9BACT|nr:DUF1501 domain-containing protein [Limnoglobus roseus]QEL14871.1 hypothetical protein PX52LOC_01770 [Limnoglobus roseus]